MKKLTEKSSKAVKIFVTVLGIITGLITCWQFYKSSTQVNLAGAWKLQFNVKSSSYNAYVGETHTQKVFFAQDDCEITGDGEKWEYNGKLLPLISIVSLNIKVQ